METKRLQPTKEVIQTWVNALRSGKYQQTTGKLQGKDGYCCIGVACKIFIPKDKIKLDDFGYIYGGYPTCQKQAPTWIHNINDLFDKKTGRALTRLNDNEKLSFDEIADQLELVYIHKALD